MSVLAYTTSRGKTTMTSAYELMKFRADIAVEIGTYLQNKDFEGIDQYLLTLATQYKDQDRFLIVTGVLNQWIPEDSNHKVMDRWRKIMMLSE